MGLLNEALKTQRSFDGTNRRLLTALISALDDGVLDRNTGCTLTMASDTYQLLLGKGYYIEIPRKRDHRNENDRRHGDRRNQSRREDDRIWN